MNYYNEYDKPTANWLRELIKQQLLPAGDVDERSIADVSAIDLKGYTQCHFFAGIGGWSQALQLAGWDPTRPVWTGSCPCQPFSSAGNQLGTADERHLWPTFANLIRECRPPIVFGEQVASKSGRQWLSGVLTDLEEMGYAGSGADLCAAGVGSPHIRQRIYWGAVKWGDPVIFASDCKCSCGDDEKGSTLYAHRLGNSKHKRLEGLGWTKNSRHQSGRNSESATRSSTTSGIPNYWDDFETAYFQGGATRRIQRGTLPLADGVPGRVVKIRGYGNAIVPQLAAEFIIATLQSIDALPHIFDDTTDHH